MSDHPFHGVFAPLVTVFDQSEQVRTDAIARNIHAYNSTALRGYMPLGSNGEFQGLQDRESLKILETVASNVNPKFVELNRSAIEQGADYARVHGLRPDA